MRPVAPGRFWKPGKLFERSEFFPGWKKRPGATETMTKAKNTNTKDT